MATFLVVISLEGGAGDGVYAQLDEFMQGLAFRPQYWDGGPRDFPVGMYLGQSAVSKELLADEISGFISRQLWRQKSTVVVVDSIDFHVVKFRGISPS